MVGRHLEKSPHIPPQISVLWLANQILIYNRYYCEKTLLMKLKLKQVDTVQSHEPLKAEWESKRIHEKW